MFVTILYAVYDPDDGALTYANGGHNPPLIVHADGSSMLLPLTDGIAVGILPEFDYDQNTVFLSPGDTIVFYTDGVTEAMNDRKEEFGMERLRDVLSADPSRDAREANLAIFQAIDAFVGDTSQFDDITCLTLRRKETDT
jgi:sigma-B regulation protein RsbU (phosphoserine phosphatase)